LIHSKFKQFLSRRLVLGISIAHTSSCDWWQKMENSNNSHQDVSTLYAHPQETKRMCWQRVGHDVDKPPGLVKGQEMCHDSGEAALQLCA
jgi:hypothetical protein